MAKYFTAYRIDHILGFFRIWELPDHAITGLIGKFRPSIPLSQVYCRQPLHQAVVCFFYKFHVFTDVQEELEKEGIWDFHRLTRPYIKKEFLQVFFSLIQVPLKPCVSIASI